MSRGEIEPRKSARKLKRKQFTRSRATNYKLISETLWIDLIQRNQLKTQQIEYLECIFLIEKEKTDFRLLMTFHFMHLGESKSEE